MTLQSHQRADLCRAGFVTERGRFYGWFGPARGPLTIASGEVGGGDEIVCTAIAPSKSMRITPVRGALLELAELVGVGPDGKVTLLLDGSARTERVCKRGLGLGPITSIYQLGDALYAVGDGGQVYRRTLAAPWQPVGDERPQLSGHAGVQFQSAILHHNRLLLGGHHVRYSAIKALCKPSESRVMQRADAIVGSVRRNEGCVWELTNNEWSPLRHDMVRSQDLWLLGTRNDLVLLIANQHIYATADFRTFTSLAEITPIMLAAHTETPTDWLFLINNRPLQKLTATGLIDAAPEWPCRSDGTSDDISHYFGLAAVMGRTFAVGHDSVLELRDNAWHRRRLVAPSTT